MIRLSGFGSHKMVSRPTPVFALLACALACAASTNVPLGAAKLMGALLLKLFFLPCSLAKGHHLGPWQSKSHAVLGGVSVPLCQRLPQKPLSGSLGRAASTPGL